LFSPFLVILVFLGFAGQPAADVARLWQTMLQLAELWSSNINAAVSCNRRTSQINTSKPPGRICNSVMIKSIIRQGPQQRDTS
jgi:hypothetical protein